MFLVPTVVHVLRKVPERQFKCITLLAFGTCLLQ